MKMPRLTPLTISVSKQLAAASLAAAFAVSPAAQAGQFSEMYIFGDSLSDTGNLYAMTTQLSNMVCIPPDTKCFPFPYPSTPPYYPAHFSNGPVWVEQLAEQMNMPPGTTGASGFSLGPVFGNIFVPAASGNNYAVAAARTATAGFFEQFGLPIPTGVQIQVDLFLSQYGSASGEALYVVVAGGNDIRQAAYFQPDPTLRDAAAANAAADYAKAIGTLADAGAKTILVGNVNDIGKIPEAIQFGKSVAATAASRAFNAALPPLLARLEAEKNVRLIRLDVFGILETVYNDATLHGGSDFGLTNAAVPCIAGFAGSPGADCAVSIFSDDIHPTTAAHAILARAAAACRDGEGGFLVPQPAATRMDFSRFCQTRQSP